MILPEFSDKYGVKKTIWEGWISGMLKCLKEDRSVELACCFPIVDESRMKHGDNEGISYYSFHAAMNIQGCTTDSSISEFIDIYKAFEPDIIHIWGSEYYHSYAAVLAAERLNLISATVVHIQGIISAIAPYYNYGVDPKWLHYSCNGINSMEDNAYDFRKRGILEKEVYKKVEVILGRTSWDKAYINTVAPNTKYRVCGEVLRDVFYNCKEKWNLSNCEKHSLFVSQAGYALKGVHLILPAIRFLKEEYKDLRLYIGGGGAIALGDKERETPYDRYILSLIDKYDIGENVFFTGLLDACGMEKQLLNSHIFVSSSTIENSSNAIGEAQMLGVPVVATYTGGTPDLIEHGKTGLLYQMDADYMFISYIKRIFDDADFATKLSENEQEVATKRYNSGRISNELMNIYQEIVGNNDGK